MRKKIVAGNWKMNKNLQEGIALAKELNEVLTADKPNCGVIICTPFIHLASVAGIIDQNIIGLGAENCADKVSGAYTGEVSAEMVKSTGANYVILGHSERRAYYHETPEILKEKVKLALANNLDVIFCIGEVLEDREAGKQNEIVKAQLEGSLFDLTAEEFSHIIWLMNPFGPSVLARQPLLTRLKRCTLSSALPSPTSSVPKLLRTFLFFMVVAASPLTLRRSSLRLTLMVA